MRKEVKKKRQKYLDLFEENQKERESNDYNVRQSLFDGNLEELQNEFRSRKSTGEGF